MFKEGGAISLTVAGKARKFALARLIPRVSSTTEVVQNFPLGELTREDFEALLAENPEKERVQKHWLFMAEGVLVDAFLWHGVWRVMAYAPGDGFFHFGKTLVVGRPKNGPGPGPKN